MGLAVWLVASWPGLVGFGGGLLVVVGLVGGLRRARGETNGRNQ
jgi:hypothetical protein